MSLARVNYRNVGIGPRYTIPFKYLDEAHLEVTVDGVVHTGGWYFMDSGASLVFSTLLPEFFGGDLQIRRVTPKLHTELLFSFVAGEPLDSDELVTCQRQLIYIMQEAFDRVMDALPASEDGDALWDALSRRITNLGPGTALTDAVTWEQVQDALAAAPGLPAVTGADDDSMLVVSAGAWAVRTAAQTRNHLGLGTAATRDVGNEANNAALLDSQVALLGADGRNIDFTNHSIHNSLHNSPLLRLDFADTILPNNVSATWFSDSSGTIGRCDITASGERNDAESSFAADLGNNHFTLQPGEYDIEIVVAVANMAAALSGAIDLRLTNDTGSTTYATFGPVTLAAAPAGATSSGARRIKRTLQGFFLPTAATLVLRGRNNAGAGAVAVFGDGTEIIVRKAKTRPVLMVTILDDIGDNYFEFMGSPYEVPDPAVTPNLEAAAESGIIYTNAEASPLCGPTRAGLQSFHIAKRHGMGTNAQLLTPDFAVDNAEILLPEALKGYLCGVFGKWHLTHPNGHDSHAKDNGWLHGVVRTANAGNNFGAGDLDHYIHREVSWTATTSAVAAQVGNPLDYVSPNLTYVGHNPSYIKDNYNAWRDAQNLVAWANANVDQPLLLLFTPNPPHEPFQCPPFDLISVDTQDELTALGIRQGEKWSNSGSEEKAQLCYRAAMEAVDTVYGWILANLDPRIVARMTSIVTGDNGTPVERVEAPFVTGHAKRTPYRQGCQVPFFVHGAQVVSGGRVCTHKVMALDIGATLLDLAATDFNRSGLAGTTIDSQSFYQSIVSTTAAERRRYFFQHIFGPNGPYPPVTLEFERLAYDDGRYRYVYRDEPDTDPTEELFDRQVDPLEATDLSTNPAYAEKLAELQARAAAILAS